METSASLYPQQKEGNGCNAESSSSPTDWQSLRARFVAGESASSSSQPSLLLNPNPEKARWARTRADHSLARVSRAHHTIILNRPAHEQTVVLLVSVGPIILNRPSLMPIEEMRTAACWAGPTRDSQAGLVLWWALGGWAVIGLMGPNPQESLGICKFVFFQFNFS